MTETNLNAENQRLDQTSEGKANWKKWGPYLSERQWGTVREDYSNDGNAWAYFSHDQSRSRAYRWGEDGLGGISDSNSLLCFGLALWNGKDPIIKERLFGLTNSEGNHGEDVKEYYFYLDSTPTHSYMKYLYKYPQAAFPYEDLINTNRGRSKDELEYELLDTGILNEDRYFDVFVEYAKASPTDLLLKISVANRDPETAELQLLPTLLFRNTWSWPDGGTKPILERIESSGGSVVHAYHTDPLLKQSIEEYYLYCDRPVPLLFTENESNNERLFNTANISPYVKDGINNYLVNGQTDAVNPAQTGTKVSPHYFLSVGVGETQVVYLRLSTKTPDQLVNPFAEVEQIFSDRLQEANEFYDDLTPDKVKANPDQANVMRQALAGMLWSKQYFYYDLGKWLEEHGVTPWMPSSQKKHLRNSEWFHMFTDDVISMPDKWEYPWFAAWDLAFHMIPLSVVDQDFAKDQLMLMLREDYLHPNGQIPAYEWNFGDVNPPVHAWATWEIYTLDRERNGGKGDVEFLKYAFSKLLINFTWWVNRKDEGGNNVFEGGFLGLDNIGVFEHTLWIAGAMDRIGDNQDELWDEEDGFFYDVLQFPDGSATRLKVRSMVGLLPLMAVTVFPEGIFQKLPRFSERAQNFLTRYPELVANTHLPNVGGFKGRLMLSVVNEDKLRRILSKMLDESEFLSDYGIRALSRYHQDHPYSFYHSGQEYKVQYVPGDSNTGMFGGNSNWRGPIWMPVNLLLIRALTLFYGYYGDEFTIECPTGSGNQMNLFEIVQELERRLSNLFLKDESGHRPVYGAAEKFQNDPHWKDLILFYEYFHGDSGMGIGASHQTGWTGCIAQIIRSSGFLTKEHIQNTITVSDLATYR